MDAVFQVKRYTMQCKKCIATGVSLNVFCIYDFYKSVKIRLKLQKKKRQRGEALGTR